MSLEKPIGEEQPSRRKRAVMATFVGVFTAVAVAYIISIPLTDMATDETWEPRVQQCVADLKAEELGHGKPSSVCAGLNDAGKREAAYQWAQSRGAF